MPDTPARGSLYAASASTHTPFIPQVAICLQTPSHMCYIQKPVSYWVIGPRWCDSIQRKYPRGLAMILLFVLNRSFCLYKLSFRLNLEKLKTYQASIIIELWASACVIASSKNTLMDRKVLKCQCWSSADLSVSSRALAFSSASLRYSSARASLFSKSSCKMTSFRCTSSFSSWSCGSTYYIYTHR